MVIHGLIFCIKKIPLEKGEDNLELSESRELIKKLNLPLIIDGDLNTEFYNCMID